MMRPLEIVCPLHGTYYADHADEPCPACEDGYDDDDEEEEEEDE